MVDGNERSVEEQETESLATCAREGWDVDKVFREPDRSASRHARKERPEYNDTIAYLRAGKADVLVVWESSRAQRDLAAYVKLRDVCAETGTLYSYKGRTYDLSKGEDRFTTGLDALLDERESEVTRDRILRSVRANAAAGRPHGPAGYGYAREYDPVSKALVRQYPHPEQAPIIREMVSMRLAGKSLRAIVATLNDRGVPAPNGSGVWHPSAVRRILLNPAYAGLRVFQGEVIGDAVWPAIITEDEHYRLRQLMNVPSTAQSTTAKYLLSGIATCGKIVDGRECGNKCYVHQPARSRKQTYSPLPCRHVARNMDAVDKHVTGVAVLALSIRPDGPELLGLEQSAGDADDAQRELAELRARLDAHYEQSAAGKLSAGGLARVEALLLPQIEQAEQAARDPGLPPVVYDVVNPDPDVVWERWRALPMDTKRLLVRTMLAVTILPLPRGRRNYPYDPASVRVELRVNWRRES